MTSDNLVPYRPTGSLNLPINYFCKRQKAENLLYRIEINLKKGCFYCHNCENCTKFNTYTKEFNKSGFWTFNKHIECWVIFDPDYNIKNFTFHIRPIKLKNGIRFNGV